MIKSRFRKRLDPSGLVRSYSWDGDGCVRRLGRDVRKDVVEALAHCMPTVLPIQLILPERENVR